MRRSRASDTGEEVVGPVAGRLDELAGWQFERVLERAIQLQNDGLGSGTPLDRGRLYEVAAEMGIDAETVDRAIHDELMAGTPTPTTRFFAPSSVAERHTVRGGTDAVSLRIRRWMTRDEGLRPSVATGDGIRWAPDTHWRTTAKVAIAGRGTKALKGLPRVTHRQIEVRPDEHVVEIEADTRRIGTVAGSVGAGLLGGAVAGGVASAVGFAGGNDLLQFLAVMVPGTAIAVGTTLTIAKAWTHAVRQGVRRALDGIAEPDVTGETRSPVRSIVDDIADTIDQLRR